MGGTPERLSLQLALWAIRLPLQRMMMGVVREEKEPPQKLPAPLVQMISPVVELLLGRVLVNTRRRFGWGIFT